LLAQTAGEHVGQFGVVFYEEQAHAYVLRNMERYRSKRWSDLLLGGVKVLPDTFTVPQQAMEGV
jgi:hypothetical protein